MKPSPQSSYPTSGGLIGNTDSHIRRAFKNFMLDNHPPKLAGWLALVPCIWAPRHICRLPPCMGSLPCIRHVLGIKEQVQTNTYPQVPKGGTNKSGPRTPSGDCVCSECAHFQSCSGLFDVILLFWVIESMVFDMEVCQFVPSKQ